MNPQYFQQPQLRLRRRRRDCPFRSMCPYCPYRNCPFREGMTSATARSAAAPSAAGSNATEAVLRGKIRAFFLQNPRPSDQEVHALAKSLGINKHKFEEIIYAMLADLIRK